MRNNQFRVGKEKYGFSQRPKRLSIAGTTSVYEGGMVYTDTEPTEALDAAKAHQRWLAVMAIVSDQRRRP